MVFDNSVQVIRKLTLTYSFKRLLNLDNESLLSDSDKFAKNDFAPTVTLFSCVTLKERESMLQSMTYI